MYWFAPEEIADEETSTSKLTWIYILNFDGMDMLDTF